MLDQILQLIGAGFKADQIMEIINKEVSPVPAPVPSPAANEPPAAPAAPAGGAAPGIDGAAVTAAIAQMGKDIIAALQKAQIGGTSAPAPVDPMAQIDAITAQIINPTHKKEE